MNRLRRLVLSAISVIAFALPATSLSAQETMKERLVGVWSLVSLVSVHGEKKVRVFGENPRGKMILTSDGHFSTLTTQATLPKFASNNRLKGTPEEYMAIVHGSNAHYGTYAVDETNRTIAFRVDVSTFPNWEGQEQQRVFTLTGDELSYSNPSSTVGAVSVHVVWRRQK